MQVGKVKVKMEARFSVPSAGIAEIAKAGHQQCGKSRPKKSRSIPTIRGSIFFCGDNSISQSDCWKIFFLDIFPPSGDPA